MLFAGEKGYNGDHRGKHSDEKPELFLADAYRFHDLYSALGSCRFSKLIDKKNAKESSEKYLRIVGFWVLRAE